VAAGTRARPAARLREYLMEGCVRRRGVVQIEGDASEDCEAMGSECIPIRMIGTLGGVDSRERCGACAVKAGRNYVSDGRSHLLDFNVNGVELGTGESEVCVDRGGRIKVTVRAAANLDVLPNDAIRLLPYYERPLMRTILPRSIDAFARRSGSIRS